jgi:hypothetical protein
MFAFDGLFTDEDPQVNETSVFYFDTSENFIKVSTISPSLTD